MLKRATIKNIGKFVGCSINGDQEFRKKTIIYGNNGNGKSTITAILRSLSSGDNKSLISRKTFGVSGGKEANLHFEGEKKPVCFGDRHWKTRSPKKFLIFDEKFILENVFDGQGVGDIHKANMYRAVVGEKGKELVEKINDIEKKITVREGEQRIFERQYSTSGFREVFSLKEFLEISNDIEIDQKINKKKKEREFASQLEKPCELNFKKRNFLEAKNLLTKEFSELHKTAGERVAEQAKKNSGGEDPNYIFLQKGFDIHQKNKSGVCPFCGQDIKPVSDLLELYAAYFDEEYKTHQKTVSSFAEKVKNWNIENEMTTLVSEASGWAYYFTDKKPLEIFLQEVEAVKQLAVSEKKEFEEECLAKAEDLTCKTDFSKLKKIEKTWERIGKATETFNEHIATFVSQTNKQDKKEILKELKFLEAQKTRYGKQWGDFCEKYDELKTEIERKKALRDEAFKELSDYSKNAFAEHQENINGALNTIGADFQVVNLAEKKDFRKAQAVYCGFEIEFFKKHKIPLEASGEQATFSNTLSNGDRSALAFAFFLSVVKNSEDLKNKIVVFDDPISSFDKERRTSTVDLLAEIMEREERAPCQLIVLTHDEQFLKKFFEDRRFNDSADCTYLEIIPDGKSGDVKKSKLVRYDREKIDSEEFKYYQKINKWINENVEIPKESLEVCRKLFESVLRVKYYPYIKEQIRKKAGITKYVESLMEEKIYTSEEAKIFLDFFPQIEGAHHYKEAESSSEQSQGDIKRTFRKTLELIKEV